MRFHLWLPLAALLSFGGCDNSSGKVTAPAVDLPSGGDAADLDRMEASFTAQLSSPARCVQLRYLSETGGFKTKQKGSNCTCLQGRPVFVTAVIWNGAYQNNVTGKASCFVSGIGTVVVAGPATAVDPGGVLGGLFGLTSYVGGQGSGILTCSMSLTVSSTRDPSNRMVICTWY